MSAYVLLSGKLFRDPQRKTSANDKPYALATVQVRDSKGSNFWQVFAFNGAAEELLGRREGEYVSVSGSMKAEVYTPEGKPPRVSLSVMSDKVISLKKPPPKSGKTDTNGHRPTQERSAQPFDDDVPF